MTGPTLEQHWRMITRDPIEPLNFEKAVNDMAWLIASGTAPPYTLVDRSYGRRLEDGNGNELAGELVISLINQMPALLLELKRLKEG